MTRHYEMTIIMDIEDRDEDDDTAKIEVHCDASEFIPWMMAAEYLTFITAQESPAGFEKALELIQKGAMKYKTIYRECEGDMNG